MTFEALFDIIINTNPAIGCDSTNKRKEQTVWNYFIFEKK